MSLLPEMKSNVGDLQVILLPTSTTRRKSSFPGFTEAKSRAEGTENFLEGATANRFPEDDRLSFHSPACCTFSSCGSHHVYGSFKMSNNDTEPV